MNDFDLEENLNETDEKIEDKHKENISTRLTFSNQVLNSNQLLNSFYSIGTTHMNINEKKISIKKEHNQIPRISGDSNPIFYQMFESNIENYSSDFTSSKNELSSTTYQLNLKESSNLIKYENKNHQNIEVKAKKEIFSNIDTNINFSNQLLNENLSKEIDFRLKVDNDFTKLIKELKLTGNQVSKKQIYYILNKLNLNYEEQDLNVLLDLDKEKAIPITKLSSFISILSRPSNTLNRIENQNLKKDFNDLKSTCKQSDSMIQIKNKTHSSRCNNVSLLNKKINSSYKSKGISKGQTANSALRKTNSYSPNFLNSLIYSEQLNNSNVSKDKYNPNENDFLTCQNKSRQNINDQEKLNRNFLNKIENVFPTSAKNGKDKNFASNKTHLKPGFTSNQLNNYTKMSEKITLKNNSMKDSNNELYGSNFLSKLFSKNINNLSSRIT